MSPEVDSNSELETAHVLFIDAVGYSKLLVNEQRELFDAINELVRGNEEFRKADATGKLVRLPTGDGMALVFNESPEQPARCAAELSVKLRDIPNLPLRMGIHSGLVSHVIDVNNQVNVTGAGINIAQRVMSFGDSGHILISKRTAEDLKEYPRWQSFLHEIGECETKHGVKIGLVNFYENGIGNPALPKRCTELARAARQSQITRTRTKFALSGVALLLVFAASFAFVWRSQFPASRDSPEIPEKSIAVLPFENLSDDKQNAYFADGIQDEILSDLAKVANLKVISRTSVMQYRNIGRRNIREIARSLGVAHILEGSVQRVSGRVHVSAQLIDARTDTHIWGEHFDRDLTDVFGIENELAERIASELKSKLSPEEKAAIEERPTSDLTAYELYLRGKLLIENAVFNEPKKASLLEAIGLLQTAVARDPAFALAYYQLAHAHDHMFLLEFDHTQARLDLADVAIRTLERLRPDSGEAHLAKAKHLYWGYRDYEGAQRELDSAKRTVPNEPLLFLLTGYIERRQGHWDKAMKNFEHAVELDPQNIFTLQQSSLTYELLRRYGDLLILLDRALAISPKDTRLRLQRAWVDASARADTKPAHAVIKDLLNTKPSAMNLVADEWLALALWERDIEASRGALALLPEGSCNGDAPFPRTWCEGRVDLLRGDAAAAREAFSRARQEIGDTLRTQPNYAQALCAAGLIDAMLGNQKEAIDEGQRSVQLLPVSRDAVDGAQMIQLFAATCAWAGQKDLAIEQLQRASTIPGYLSYGALRLDPLWDPLRGDPRFDKIVASLAPK